MEDNEQKKGFAVMVRFISVLIAFVGYILFEKSLLHMDTWPVELLAIYQFVKGMGQIFSILGISIISSVGKPCERLYRDRWPTKAKWPIKLMKVLIFLACTSFSFLVGISVAEDEVDVENIRKDFAAYIENHPAIISAEAVKYYRTVSEVEIEIIPSGVSEEKIERYNIEKFEPKKMSIIDFIKNPLTFFVHLAKGTGYDKYEIVLLPSGRECPSPTPSPSPSLTPDNTREDRIIVFINEVFVKKDGETLVKLQRKDAQDISYGLDSHNMKTDKFSFNPNGVVVELNGEEGCYVSWHGSDPDYVRKGEQVTFEDNFIETNTPLLLTTKTIKEHFGDRLPGFTEEDLKISIRSIDPDENVSIGPDRLILPLQMSTREGGILYHVISSQGDFYFAVNTLADRQEFIDKREADQSDYRLLCEIIVE